MIGARRSARAEEDLVAQVYDAMDRDLFPVPPITLHSPSPELLAGAWAVFRETVLCGAAPREYKETVAATVARANRCPFCVDAHTLFLHGLGCHRVARWLAADAGAASPPGTELARIVEWASAVRSPGSPALRDPPFEPAWAPELVGTAVAFQYVTAMVTLFLGPTPVPWGLRRMKGTARRILGRALSRRLARRAAPGLSLDLLPEAPLPPALSWAAPNPKVAGAFARLGAAVDRCGRRVLSPEVRSLVTGRLKRWCGETPPLGNAWLDAGLDTLPGVSTRHRDRALLALLAALAPERVTPRHLELQGAGSGGRREALEIAAWGAFAAALRAGEWLRGPY